MSWTNQQLSAIWNKGEIAPGYDPSEWRLDACRAFIAWRHYGDRNSDHGWEVDHIQPNGDDSLSNLRPLHWKNNAAKQDGKLRCVVSART